MRNPLSRALPMNLGTRQPDNRSIPPVPEGRDDINFPYRGQEKHGVEPTALPYDTPGHGAGREVPFEEPAPEPDPIPVVIRTMGGRELRKSRFYQSVAPAGKAVQLVGRDESRIMLRVKNLGASNIYIGDLDTTANANEGWPLAQNGVLEIETQDTLYATSSHATDGMRVAVSVVYSLEL